MSAELAPQIATVAAAGVAAGLALLVRGAGSYRAATRIEDTGTSRIATLAAGEVRISGVVEPAELSLVSPLQSKTCIYYRSRIDANRDRTARAAFDEERAVGFRVRDESGAVRVFPRGASWEVPVTFDARSDLLNQPDGLLLRSGPAVGPGALDHDAAVAALLTVRTPTGDGLPDDGLGMLAASSTGAAALDPFAGFGRSVDATSGRHYTEARIEPGDVVTVVGRAIPFGDLSDPDEADVAIGASGLVGADDPEVAGDLAEARAAGVLASSPEAAWGNAAIPGFGIGRPVRPAVVDPAATPLAVADAETADRARRTFEIAPDTLVVVGGGGSRLLIAAGSPGVASARLEGRFLVGLLGAILAIGSAIALGLVLSGAVGG